MDNQREKAIELLHNVKGGMERRFDGKIIVVGHLMAGKTTLINNLLHQHIDMRKNERTNGIVTIRVGAFLDKKGTWVTTDNPKDSMQVLRRMESAKSQDVAFTKPVSDENLIDLAEETLDKVSGYGNRIDAVAYTYNESTNTKLNDGGKNCRLHFMDFAGQSVFNSTHQMFMTNRAVYLVVIDISRQLNSEVEDDDVHCVGANQRMSVKDFTAFLLSSIHVYSGDQKESFPKVLLVGTHKDKVRKALARQRMKYINAKFRGTPLQKLVLGYFIVDCTNQNDDNIDRLRQFIFEIIQKEPYWGEETPTRWLPLESSIIEHRDRGERVLTMLTIKKMKDECFVKLEDDDEIGKFLQYHNAIGTVIYFGGTSPGVIVILDPQWLIDALKQIITHDRFYCIPEGLQVHWKEFNECAKLHNTLIEAIWSKNKDKTFITHMRQLLIVLEKTDIIARPLSYSKDGTAEVVDYYFVPSMLKPNKEGKARVEDLMKKCCTKSPSLCFVFQNRFMQPAIFPRIQAECTKIYKIKKVENQPLIFHQVAVFQLHQNHDLILEHVGHMIKIVIINEMATDIDSEICENVRVTLEDALTNIVRLYGGNTVPFHKALQCRQATGNLDALLTWTELENSQRILCKSPQHKQHWMSKTEVLGPWLRCKITDRTVKLLAKKGNAVASDSPLEFIQLARLARRLEFRDLLVASRTIVPDVVWEQCRFDNKGNIVGEVYGMLTKWSNKKGFLTLNTIHKALTDTDSSMTMDVLKTALTDTDSSQYLKDVDEEFLETTVSDEVIGMISQNSATWYGQLALELGIDHNVITCVDKDIDGVTHRAKRLLNMWRENSSSKFKEVARAIIEVDENKRLLMDCQQLMTRKPEDVEQNL